MPWKPDLVRSFLCSSGSWCLFLVALSSTCRTFASDTDGSVARVFDTAGSGAHVFDTAGALARVFEGLNEGFNISHYLFSTGKLSSNGEGRSFFSKPRRRAFSLGLFSVPDDTTLRVSLARLQCIYPKIVFIFCS